MRKIFATILLMKVKADSLKSQLERVAGSPPKVQKKVKAKVMPTKTPKNWLKTYNLISQYRKNNPAWVDSMGCHHHPNSDKKLFRYHILTSLQLSSQTKDPINYEAMGMLKALPKGLTPEAIRDIDENQLNEIIGKVGFHNRKTVYMKKTANILLDEYEGDIPQTLDGLLKLPGIGPKMAYLCLQEAWGTVLGIGVDTHVHRICNRLGWVKSKNPEATRTQLEDWLPNEYWKDINSLLVGYGQTLCKPVGPICAECPVKEYCPRVNVGKKIQ